MTEREIFVQAIDLEPSARLRFVAEACAGDAGLQARVEKLLAAHDESESVLDRPPVASSGSTDAALDDSTTTLVFLGPSSRSDSLGRVAHYEVLRLIGEGAFGMVFLAFDEQLQREVAIKMLKPELAASSLAKERFLREARSAAAIRHENAVQVHAVDSTPLPYLVMEYVDGPTLGDRLQEQGRIPFAELLTLGAQIARGLAAAHARGLVHRDIKPGNMLLERDRPLHVKITDFGLARAVDDAGLSHSHLISGTPRYMAPEQALGDTIDARSDLFSLGSVLYEMASGQQAFPASTLYGALKAVADASPRPLREVSPDLPTEFCALVEQLHAKSPSERPASAAQVAERLEALRQPSNPAPSSIPASTPEAMIAGPPSDRSPKNMTGGATMIASGVTIVAAIAFGFFLSGRGLWQDDSPPKNSPAPPTTQRPEVPPTNDAIVDAAVNAPAPTEPPPVAAPEPPPPDRRGADFVLKVGGKLTIADVEGERQLSANDPLPTSDFRLLKIDLEEASGITNLGLESFRGCQHVTELTLHSKNVGDEGIANFSDCKQLRKLDLDGTGVTDLGMVAFRDCNQLEELDLSHTQVGDGTLALFANCESLRTVRLASTKVTDEGLLHLAKSQELRKLDLSETPIEGTTLVQLFVDRRPFELSLSRGEMAPATFAEIMRRFLGRVKFDKPKRPTSVAKPPLSN